MGLSEKGYDTLIVSSLIVLLSILGLFSSHNLMKEMQKENLLTGFAVSSQQTNQTLQTSEAYSIKAYTVFYLSLIFIIIVIAIISLILIVPRIKKYT